MNSAFSNPSLKLIYARLSSFILNNRKPLVKSDFIASLLRIPPFYIMFIWEYKRLMQAQRQRVVLFGVQVFRYVGIF